MPLGYGDDQFRVPKQAIEVEVQLEGQVMVHGRMFVGEASRHAGRERVLDVLTAPEPFVPIASEGGARLLAKNRIVLVRVNDRADAGWEESEATSPQVSVEIRLAGMPPGRDLVTGNMMITMPEGRRRLLDFVNDAGPFLALWEPDAALIVARGHVVEIRQVD